jgi:predicted transcriptional regulator
MKNRILSADIPADLAEKVEELAHRLEKPQGWIVEQALSDWFALRDERRALTLEALADVDRGATADHDSVERWAASLGTSSPLTRPI